MQNIINRVIFKIREMPIGGTTSIAKLLEHEQELSSREKIQIANAVLARCKQQNIAIVPMPGYRGIVYDMPFHRKESDLNEITTQTFECPRCGSEIHIDWSQIPSTTISARIFCSQCEGFEQMLFNPYFVGDKSSETQPKITTETRTTKVVKSAQNPDAPKPTKIIKRTKIIRKVKSSKGD